MDSLTVVHGFPHQERAAVAELYDEAFGQKLGLAIPNANKRRALLELHCIPCCSFVAYRNARIVGIAGFQTGQSGFVASIGIKHIAHAVGWCHVPRALMFLSLFHRSPKPQELLMDGICVHSSERGSGIGTLLLQSVVEHARNLGCTSVRLDVIDTNPRARMLYERFGFRETKRHSFSALQPLLGFGGSSTLHFRIGAVAPGGPQYD
jgi:ribosomal protein S18 acetylase RimI-like enzyme